MQFIIDVPVNYVHTELRGNDTASIFSSQSVKDSLNARIRRIYSEYGIELYIVVINSLDVIVNTSLPANATTKDFFIRKLYDEQTNIASVKALHDQITQSIISQSLSGHNRDCIIYSDAQYRGCFFADGKKGCWEYSVVSDHNGTERTYPKLGELQYLFSARLLNNFSAHSGGLSYMLPVVVDEFDEAAKYMQLKGLIQQSFTPQQLDAIFSGFDETTDYENLSESERIHALSVYTGYPMLGDWYIGTSQETNAIRIIEYTPADDVHELLYDLSQPNPLKNNPYYDGDKTDDALITKLIHHTDDGMMGLGDDNYAKLISVLVKLETSCKEEIDFRTPQDDAAWQNRNIEWKDGQVMAPIGALDYDITQEDNGTVTVTRKIVSEWHKTGYNATSGEYTYDPVWSTDATFNLNPFDLVFFTNHSSVGMLEAAGAQHGQVFVAPAIMLKYAADKTFNQSSLETVALAFDALTLMTGPGAIFKALESGRMALAAFEATQFLGSTGNLVANTVADPDLQSLVDKYNMIVGVWGLSKIATNGVQFTVSYFSEAATGELHAIPASTAQDFENTFHQAGTKVDDLPAEMKERVTKMEEYLEEKVGVGNQTLNEYVTAIDGEVSIIAHDETLPQFIKDSFRNKVYKTGMTTTEITAYRNFGDLAVVDGSFVTTTSNATREQLALVPDFHNSMRFKATLKIPANEKINFGKVGPWPPDNPIMNGGADQLVLPENYDQNWITSILDTETNQTYTFEQFKAQFPDLVKRK